MICDREEIVRKIEEALAQRPRLSLSLFCREIKLGRHLASRAIREVKGKSFRDLQHEVLLKKAKEMLAEPGVKIHDVAHALGYRWSEDFSRFLRNKTSRPPREIRRDGNGKK
ncbi:MAG: AraC family transcriptional regulator [Acidobacteria bacterium]|nr:MAG: AraC family transcriptional regulator [Acidobacteriota bacterium]